METAPAVVNLLAGGSSGAQRGVMAAMLGKVPSDWGSAIGVEGSGPPSLLFEMSCWLIVDEGRELV